MYVREPRNVTNDISPSAAAAAADVFFPSAGVVLDDKHVVSRIIAPVRSVPRHVTTTFYSAVLPVPARPHSPYSRRWAGEISTRISSTTRARNALRPLTFNKERTGYVIVLRGRKHGFFFATSGSLGFVVVIYVS